MNDVSSGLALRPSWPRRLPLYYGWINVLVASAAMTATLPGRTHGLGLITESILADLPLDHVLFARINLVGSLIGALFAMPAGRLIDRIGVRKTLAAVLVALAISVLAMSRATGAVTLLVTLILVRGLGQSALSVVSMAAIGKWFSRRLGMAMGVFAVLLTFGFIASVLALGEAVQQFGWRAAWEGVGFSLLALVPFAWLLVRDTPEACGLPPDEPLRDEGEARASYSLRRAAATPAFWVVVLGGSAFNLVWSAVTLFNESMLMERGLPQASAVEIMAILTGMGLVANLAGGALATRAHVVKLLGAGMALLAAALLVFPSISSPGGAQFYAALMGLSGGVVTVVFFAAWGHLFGREHLGRIQGAAQLATVLASAAGPLVLAESRAWTGSYGPVLYVLAVIVAAIGVAALVVPLPANSVGDELA
jgi:MFS transporter, OFA family, oxalate/formate antiporter